jgi:uncharacterized protein (TIRG00374 family)
MGFIRKHLSLALRILISGAVLWVLARKMDWPQFFAYVAHARADYLCYGLAIIGVTMVVGTYRWRMLLHVQDIDLPFAKLFPMNMIGQFFNAFLLGVTGGDVIKIYYVTQAAPGKRSAAGLSVIYDRILGLLGIMVWGLILTTVSYSFLTSTPQTHQAVWTFLLICCAAVGGISFALVLPWIRKHAGLWKLEQKLPFHGTIENLSDAFQRYARSPVENITVLAMSICIHGCIFLTMYVIALAIGLHASFWQLAAIVSIVNVLIAIPINVAGLGVREALFVYFLALIQIPQEQAITFSLLGYGLNLFWSVIGGFFYMRYKKHGEPISNLVSTSS